MSAVAGRSPARAGSARRSDDRDAPENLRRALMKPHARAVPQRLRAGKHLDAASASRVSSNAPGVTSACPRAISSHLDAAEVDGRALPGHRLRPLLAVHLHAAHLHPPAARRTHQLVVGATRPDTSVPVTTVPKPFIENTRSIGSRGRPVGRARCAAPATLARAPRAARRAPRRSSPRPARSARLRETSPRRARAPPAARAPACPRPPGRPSSARRRRRGRRSSRQMSKCSRVCGITDSSAATTSTHDVDAADAGEHVLDEALVAGHVDEREVRSPSSVRCAKPRSIVIPRAFSSFSRSGSVPVSARTSALLPWSMCPAVPTTMDRIDGT